MSFDFTTPFYFYIIRFCIGLLVSMFGGGGGGSTVPLLTLFYLMCLFRLLLATSLASIIPQQYLGLMLIINRGNVNVQ